MGNTYGNEIMWPENYKVSNDGVKFVVFTKTLRVISSTRGTVSYYVKSVIPKTSKWYEHEHIVEMNKITTLSERNPYRVVVCSKIPDKPNTVRIHNDLTFRDKDEATNFYIETKAKL